MKRANGTGTVIKLKGNRRNPYCAKATVSYKSNGLPEQKIISNERGIKYFKTRIEADAALAWWNLNKGYVDMDKKDYTFEQVLNEWIERYVPNKEERCRMRKTHETIKRKNWFFKCCWIISRF